MNNFQSMSDEDFQALLDDWDEWDRRERENDIPDELKTIEGYGSGWKEIEEFPDYEVSVYGEVYSKHTGKILSVGIDKGYHKVVLCKNKKMHTKSVHRLVAKAFLPNPNNLPEVNHKDTCKGNNRLTNLEWCTRSENMKHAYKTGLVKLPETNYVPRKKVKIVETGQVFDSICACARYLGDKSPNKTHITDCLAGRRKTHKGYHFEEVYDE